MCYSNVRGGRRSAPDLRSLSFAALLLSLFISSAFGQQSTAIPASTPVNRSEPTTSEKIKRWFEFDALSIATRYRLIRNATDRTIGNAQQYQFAGRGHFKFDKGGKYSIYAGLFTGSAIIAGWNNTGIGTGGLQTNLYLKQLYIDAKPIKGVEFQVGGIAMNNGENTEITGYDNDAYLTGERIAVRLPKKFYFDEISAANGYVGDLTSPAVGYRLKHLSKSNFHQFLVRKQVNKRVSYSADYTFEAGRDTLHEAVKIKIPESHILDWVLFENYQRVDPNPGYGFGLSGEKLIKKKITLGGGFTRIDRPMLNADRYPPGKRLYAGASIKLTHEITLGGILIEGVGDLPSPTSVRTRFELILNYNILELLRRKKVF